MSKEQIKEYVRELKVPFLAHFTRIENLSSIMNNGILPVTRFQEIDYSPIGNDKLRLDGHLGAISLSIAFPNYKMFYKYRQENGGDWVVLGLWPSILWEKDCAFCMHNAADGRIRCRDISSLKSLESLQSLYLEIEGITPRLEQGIKRWDPTDAQAEILVFDRIEPERIGAVIFNSSNCQKWFQENFPGIKTFLDSRYFSSRSHFRRLQREIKERKKK